MSASLKRRIERMERLIEAVHGGSQYDDYENADGVILIPEILIAARRRWSEAIQNGHAPPDHTPERLEELKRRGRELRQRIEARQRLRRMRNPQRRGA